MDVITLSSDEESDPLRRACSSTVYKKEVPSPKPNQPTVIQKTSDITVSDTVGSKHKYGSRKRINPTTVLNGSSTSRPLTDFGPSCSRVKSEPPSNDLRETVSRTISSKESKFTSSTGLNGNDKSILFKEFLDACNAIVQGTDMDIIISKAWRSYTTCNPNYVESKDFTKLLNKKMDDLKKDATNIYSHLLEVCTELKSRKLKSRPSGGEPPTKKVKVSCDDNRANHLDEEKPTTSSSKQESATAAEVNSDNSDNEEDRRKRHLIKKLNTQLTHCSRVIKKLEEAEVDWDDDDDSTYMQVQLWRQRAVKLYKKICEYTGERDKSSYRIHLTMNSHTKFPEVDRCIRKFVNDTGEFPDFQDVLKIYKEYNAKDNLNLTPIQLQNHAADMFQMIGNELQRKRQLDNWDLHCDFLLEEPDPADDDLSLTSQLKNNRQQFISKINQIVDEFAKKQVEEKLEPTEVTEEEANNSEEENSEADNDIEEEMEEIEQELAVSIVNKVIGKMDGTDAASSDSLKSECSTVSENSILNGIGLIRVSFSKELPVSADMETMSPSDHRSEPSGSCEEKPLIINDNTRLDNPLQKDSSSSICTKTITSSLSSPTTSKNDSVQTLTPVPETDIVQLVAKTSVSNCDASVSSAAADTPCEDMNANNGGSVGINNDSHLSLASNCVNNINADSNVVKVNTDCPVKVNDVDKSISFSIPSPEVVNNKEVDSSVNATVVDHITSNSSILSSAEVTKHEDPNSARDSEKLWNGSHHDSCLFTVPGGRETKGSEDIENSQAIAVGVGYSNESLSVSSPADVSGASPTFSLEADNATTTAVKIKNDNCSVSTSAVIDKNDPLLVTTETNEDSGCSISSKNVNQIISSLTAMEANSSNIKNSVDGSSISATAVDVGIIDVDKVVETDIPCSETLSPYSEEKGIANIVLVEMDHSDSNGLGISIHTEKENEITLPDKMDSDNVMPQDTTLSPIDNLDESIKVLTLPKVEHGDQVVGFGEDSDSSTISPALLQAVRDLDDVSSDKSESSMPISVETNDKLSVPEIIEDNIYPKIVSVEVGSNAVPCPVKEEECHPSQEEIVSKEINVDEGDIIDDKLNSCPDVTSDTEVDLQIITNDFKPDNPSLGALANKNVTLQESNLQSLPRIHTKIKDGLTTMSPDQIDPSEFCSVQIVDDSGKVITTETTLNDPSEIDIGSFLSVEIEADNVKKRVSLPRNVSHNKVSNIVSNFFSIEVDTLSPNTPTDHPATESTSDPLEDEVEFVAITRRVQDDVKETDPDVVIEKMATKKFLAVTMTPNRNSKSFSLPKLVQKEEDIDISNYLSVEVNCDNSPLLDNVPKTSLKSTTDVKQEGFVGERRDNPYHQKKSRHSKRRGVSSVQNDMNKFVAVEIGLTVGNESGRRPTPVAAKSKSPFLNSKSLHPVKISPTIVKQSSNNTEKNSNFRKTLPSKGGGSLNSSLLKLSNQGSITVERVIPSLKVRPLGRPGFSSSKNMSQLPTIDDDIIVLD